MQSIRFRLLAAVVPPACQADFPVGPIFSVGQGPAYSSLYGGRHYSSPLAQEKAHYQRTAPIFPAFGRARPRLSACPSSRKLEPTYIVVRLGNVTAATATGRLDLPSSFAN